MIPITVQVPAFSVAGVAVRTCNRDEAQPERARIGALWDQFFTESWARQLPGPGADGRLYGVYSAYESDQHPYDPQDYIRQYDEFLSLTRPQEAA